MINALIEFLNRFPPEVATIAMAALPITELNLAIPIAVSSWKLHPLTALVLAIIGNLLPFFPLYFCLEWVRDFFEERVPVITRGIDKLIDRAKRKMEGDYAKYGAIGLIVFLAIPLPLTGLYTATLAAVAFKIPLKEAWWGIFAGTIVAGIVIVLITTGVRAVI